MTILGMSLKIKGYRKLIQWSIWAALGILFLIFLIRVATFENYYYNEKEGSERAVSIENNDDEEELIEVEPTEQEVREYTVAPDRPRYLTIEKLGIRNARILAMGINSKGELDTLVVLNDMFGICTTPPFYSPEKSV